MKGSTLMKPKPPYKGQEDKILKLLPRAEVKYKLLHQQAFHRSHFLHLHLKMADFSFLSDSDDEKAAKLILSQASDSIVLEQIAALNCSGFTDSVLPSQLESRFHKLKSFPSVSSKPKPVIRNHSTVSSDFKNSKGDDDDDASLNLGKISAEKTGDDSKNEKSLNFSGEYEKSEKTPNGEKGLKENLEPDFDLSPLKLSPEDDFYWDSMKLEDKKGRKKRGELKSPIERSSSLPSGYSSESLSPPKKSGCFWCSPKRVSRNNSKNRKSFDVGSKKEVDLLGDLNCYLEKKQKKLMKKAMEEEEKICREAEKIVKLAKQASARIEISDIDDELSDTESLK